ncbi:MAG: phosphate acyltransferase [Thermoleophilaceae bacterium]|jgi:glycerol-3-phosphate acyltransferase PlsX|nr:phosphate acyltransferase [Thermoleophilaceae bacterium]
MIALDAHGADGGVDVVVAGGELSGVPVQVFGPPLTEIRNDEEPALAVRSRQDASIVHAARAVGAGEADGLVSAGPTGATLAAAVLHVKRIRGVHRPAVAAVLPIPGGRPTLLLDAGANVEVRPEHLVQFAYLGAQFMEAVHGVSNPRVGLLSNGEEPKKGTEDVIAAHARLAEGTALNFVGNVEGSDVTRGVADVIVTDGFTGNVALKLMEGTASTVTGAIRDAIRSSPVSALGGLLIRSRVSKLREQIDPNATGGAILLGVRRPVVIAHGKSTPEGIANAVRLAQRIVDEKMVEKTAARLESAGVLRSAPAASVAQPDD